MKTILFLDDDKGRHSIFRRISIGHSVDYVFTVEECISALKNKTYDIISLDHDLTGETYVDQSRKDCGMEVVRFLEANRIPQGRIICHSYNTKARFEMQKRLALLSHIKSAIQIPFALYGYESELTESDNEK